MMLRPAGKPFIFTSMHSGSSLLLLEPHRRLLAGLLLRLLGR
jgi:hypothetical protein